MAIRTTKTTIGQIFVTASFRPKLQKIIPAPMRAAGILAAAALAFGLLGQNVAAAQGMYAYPAKGQTPEQQSRDRGECHGWAVQQSGYDPSNPQASASAAPPPASAPPQGGLVRGAARGAAVGAVGGAIAGDAGKGAAIGAASGGMIGGMRRRGQMRQQQYQQQQYQQQQQAAMQQGAEMYNRAFSACMQGRGYTVQ